MKTALNSTLDSLNTSKKSLETRLAESMVEVKRITDTIEKLVKDKQRVQNGMTATTSSLEECIKHIATTEQAIEKEKRTDKTILFDMLNHYNKKTLGWFDANGKAHPIHEMSDEYISNCIDYLKGRKDLDTARKIYLHIFKTEVFNRSCKEMDRL